MKYILLITILFLTGRYFYLNHFEKEEWTGYFYPDSSNLSSWIESDEVFEDIESCREWVDYQADISFSKNPSFYEEDGDYDYECGLNCEYRAHLGMNVCSETVQ